MKAQRKVATVAGACLTVALICGATYYYAFLGTPEHSLTLLSQSIQCHDLAGTKDFYDTEAICDAALSYVVNTERQRWLASAGDASSDSLMVYNFWRSFELTAKSSMRDAAESSFRQLVEGTDTTMPDSSLQNRGFAFEVTDVHVEGKIATVIVSRPDRKPLIDSPYGKYSSVTYRMRETGGRHWKVVEVRHPPQSGWLDEWGRLKGGHPLSLGVAPRRALVMDSKLSAGSIRFFLFADVLADLLQLETDRGHRVTTGPEMLAREIPLLAAQSGYGNGALPFEKPDHRGHRMLGGNGDAHMHMVRHQMAIQNLALFLPGQSVEDFSQLPARFSEQHLAPPLGDEHDMVFAVPS